MRVGVRGGGGEGGEVGGGIRWVVRKGLIFDEVKVYTYSRTAI